jgi:hypothetical protein
MRQAGRIPMLERRLHAEVVCAKPTSTGCLKLRKAHWYLSRPPKRSPLKPTECHKSPQKNWPQGVCSHKCREDKTITLIVAKSPQIDLVVL